MKGSGHGIIEILSKSLPGGTQKSHENLQDTCFLTDILSRHLLNTSLEHYCWCNLFGN
jgi:hypothetical protein